MLRKQGGRRSQGRSTERAGARGPTSEEEMYSGEPSGMDECQRWRRLWPPRASLNSSEAVSAMTVDVDARTKRQPRSTPRPSTRPEGR